MAFNDEKLSQFFYRASGYCHILVPSAAMKPVMCGGACKQDVGA